MLGPAASRMMSLGLVESQRGFAEGKSIELLCDHIFHWTQGPAQSASTVTTNSAAFADIAATASGRTPDRFTENRRR
ncbi:MAG: hypothetical protein JJ911_17195 [Rhizobiaceae bacterium]|nr:hypothetical protein [Rhizobiaceae bacterium]